MQLQVLGDKTAIFLSSLCVIHCILTPILVIAIPSLGGVFWLEHEVFHNLLLFFVVPVGLLALMAGYKHHHNHKVLLCGLTGLVMLTLIAIAGHDFLNERSETLITLLATVFILFAHIKNFQLRQHD
ncbi:MerC domain-containing protein [Neptunicella marina]|nr:MerC domain-containing protein [Neptunicella marina]